MDRLLPLRTRLKKFQSTSGALWEVVERDYFLSWILHVIAQDPGLRIVFKGGTALKKCYFGAYRFSEDLDFTALPDAPQSFEASMNRIVQNLSNQVNAIEPFHVTCEKYREKEPHPEGQEAYVFKGKFEWHRASHVKVFVEISRNEKICFPPIFRAIHHEYGEKLDGQVLCYSLEEIVLEKLRGILQQTQKIHEKEWSRSRVRDYYDLWRILTAYQHEIDTVNIPPHLITKCSYKNVSFTGASSFFDEAMVAFVKKTWQQWLAPLVSDLPASELVLRELKPLISKMVD